MGNNALLVFASVGVVVSLVLFLFNLIGRVLELVKGTIEESVTENLDSRFGGPGEIVMISKESPLGSACVKLVSDIKERVHERQGGTVLEEWVVSIDLDELDSSKWADYGIDTPQNGSWRWLVATINESYRVPGLVQSIWPCVTPMYVVLTENLAGSLVAIQALENVNYFFPIGEEYCNDRDLELLRKVKFLSARTKITKGSTELPEIQFDPVCLAGARAPAQDNSQNAARVLDPNMNLRPDLRLTIDTFVLQILRISKPTNEPPASNKGDWRVEMRLDYVLPLQITPSAGLGLPFKRKRYMYPVGALLRPASFKCHLGEKLGTLNPATVFSIGHSLQQEEVKNNKVELSALSGGYLYPEDSILLTWE